MIYSFTAYGHSNITSTHKTTLEFTKDLEIGKEADCIIGVNSDFDYKELMNITKKTNKIKIIIKINNLKEEVNCEVNPSFDDDREIVIRRSEFSSKRTLGINADKASCDLKKELVDNIKKRIKYQVFLSGNIE